MSVEFEHVAVAKVLGVSELVRTLLTYDCAAKSLLRGLQDFSKSRSRCLGECRERYCLSVFNIQYIQYTVDR